MPDTGGSAKRWYHTRHARYVSILATFIAVYAAAIFGSIGPYLGGSDSSGYMNYAASLYRGELTMELQRPSSPDFAAISPEYFVPLGYRYSHDLNRLIPSYPIGYPMFLYFSQVASNQERALRILTLGISLFSVIGLWITAGKFGFEHPYRLFIVAAFAFSPLTILSSTVIMSDAMSAALAIWIVAISLSAGNRTGLAALVGFLFGVAVLVRASNALMIFPALTLILWNGIALRSVAAFGLGGLPAFILWLSSNKSLYGSYFTSSYGDLSYLFSTTHFIPTLRFYAAEFPTATGPLIAALSAISILWLLHRRKLFAALFAWTIPLTVFYAFYEPTRLNWLFLRFVLPAFPALALAAAVPMQSLAWRLKHPDARFLATHALPALAILFVIAHSYHLAPKLLHFQIADGARVYRDAALAFKAKATDDAIAVAWENSGSLYFFTDFPVFRWDAADEDAWQLFENAVAASASPAYAILNRHEVSHPRSPPQRSPSSWIFAGELAPGVSLFEFAPPQGFLNLQGAGDENIPTRADRLRRPAAWTGRSVFP